MLAFIFPSDTFGGHEIMSHKIIQSLQNQRINVHCYVSHSNKRLVERLKGDQITIHLMRFYNSKFDRLLGFLNPWIAVNIYQLRSIKDQYKHVIVVNGNAVSNHGTTLAVAFLSSVYKIRSSMYIPMIHTASELGLSTIKALFYEASIRRALNSVSDIWIIDNEWRDRVLCISNKFKTYVIKNWVEHFPQNDKPILKLHYGVELCFVGRIEKRQKGLDYLIKLLEEVETNKEILMHIVGDGPDLDWLKMKVKNGLFKSKIKFKFHGWVSKPIQIISGCDAMIIPSRVEGMPLVAIESLMIGTPIFAFSIPGIRNLVSDEFIAPPFLVKELSEKLNTFLLKPRSSPKPSSNLIELMDVSRFEHELNCAITGALQT